MKKIPRLPKPSKTMSGGIGSRPGDGKKAPLMTTHKKGSFK
jgi:hypothetical protein